MQRFEEKIDALVQKYHPLLYAKYSNTAYSKVGPIREPCNVDNLTFIPV